MEWQRRVYYLGLTEEIVKKALVGTTEYLNYLIKEYGPDAKICNVIKSELQK